MANDITLKQVNSRRDLNKFIAFPNKLFKDSPTYIPFPRHLSIAPP